MHSGPLRGDRLGSETDTPVGACKSRYESARCMWLAAALAVVITPALARDSGTETPYPQRACNDLCKYWMSLGSPAKREEPPDMNPTGSPIELGAPAFKAPSPSPPGKPPRRDPNPGRAAPTKVHLHQPGSAPSVLPIERPPSPAQPRADPFGPVPGSVRVLPPRFDRP